MKHVYASIIVFFSSLAYSATWNLVEEKVGDKYYLDSDSVVKLSGNERQYWILRSSKESPDKVKIQSVKTREVIDCKTMNYRLDYLIQYSEKMGKGTIINEQRGLNSANDIVIPDSLGELIAKKVCSKLLF